MVSRVKHSLRLDDEFEFDEEIVDLIEGCKADLKLSGVTKITETDPLIVRAIITYCRANFDVSNKDYERYISSYDSLKAHLSLSSEYTSD